MLTQAELKKQLSYNPETGVFTRIASETSCVKIGDIAGCNAQGYIQISVKNKKYRAHRLVWLYITGSFPEKIIDHINWVKTDNRFCSLREATNAENMWNRGATKGNTSGFKGVSWDKERSKWGSQIKIHGKTIRLGRFDNPEDAHKAYCDASKKLHGEFTYSGALQ